MTEYDYYKTNVLLVNGNQKLNISTQNHANNTDEHYLRPKGITQVVTEDSGAQWFYTFDGKRRLTAVAPPGLAGRVRLTYFDNDKVKSVTNAYGTWTYVYTTPGDFGTTTVTNPLGEQTFVKYHREHGYVTEARDALNRWTYYTYDSGHRLTRVTYPEQNYVALSYDGRGNILVQTVVPKPGAGLPQIRTAGFEGGCVSRKTCNRPLYVIDAKGNRTDFTYGPIVVGPVGFYGQPNDVGEGKPLTITSPAPFSGAVRPQVRNEYSEGLLVKTSTCKTLASCTGTDDEVVTAYNYGGTQGNANLLFGLTVTSAGVALTTCYGYDDQARRISETPPGANVASCPMGTSASLAANAIAPVAPYARVTPIFPDGSSGSPPATSYDPSTDPSDNCGTNGVICQ